MSALQPALTRLPLATPGLRTTMDAGAWDGLAVGDLDGDDIDEVVVRDAAAGATALRSRPGFGFSPWFAGDGPDLAGPLVARDVDRDGWIDLVISDGERGEIALLRGQEGGFAAPVRSPGPEDAAALALADLDGDGVDDVVTWRRAGYVSVDEARAGSLWSARGVGEHFESPVEFAFAGDPRRVVGFDGDGDGRSELLALQAAFSATPATDSDESGAGLLTLALTDDAFALVDKSMSLEFAASEDVIVGDLSDEHVGDELLRIGSGAEGPEIVIESRSSGRRWVAGTLPAGRTLGLTRADFDADGIVDLLVCREDGLMLATGRAWNAFAPAVPVSRALRRGGGGGARRRRADRRAHADRAAAPAGGDGAARARAAVAAAAGARRDDDGEQSPARAGSGRLRPRRRARPGGLGARRAAGAARRAAGGVGARSRARAAGGPGGRAAARRRRRRRPRRGGRAGSRR
ncbi:FG-GAP repeat domain-containing protein [Nannocystis pusilla]|uniref:FG-GAP repeat domain-containing protein n=1 Tax=Nannocystis pusilla TaxID=889268 RepID=UPI003B7DA519